MQSQPRTVELKRGVIDRAKPEPKPYRIHDTKTPGLFLRVQPSGTKVFYVAWARNAATPLGRYPHITLEQARTMALRALAEAREHGAPAKVAAKRDRVTRAAGERIETLGDLIEHRCAPWVRAERKAGAATLAALKADFGDWFDRKLGDLSAWHLERYKADRLKLGRKLSTVNRELVRINALLSKAVEWGLVAANPFRGVKPSRVDDGGRVRFLSDAEEMRMRDALAEREAKRRTRRERGEQWRAPRGHARKGAWSASQFTDHLSPIVLLALNTGLRRGELFELTWADVDLERRIVTVRGATAKAGRTRHVALSSEAASVLTRWKGRGDHVGRVFSGTGGARVTNIAKSWDQLTHAAGIVAFRFHDCRHHFASRLVMAGVDLNTVRELLGHADIAMTLRYAHLAPEHKADAVARLVRDHAIKATRRP